MQYIKNLIVLILCESTSNHPYNIAAISILSYLVKNIWYLNSPYRPGLLHALYPGSLFLLLTSLCYWVNSLNESLHRMTKITHKTTTSGLSQSPISFEQQLNPKGNVEIQLKTIYVQIVPKENSFHWTLWMVRFKYMLDYNRFYHWKNSNYWIMDTQAHILWKQLNTGILWVICRVSHTKSVDSWQTQSEHGMFDAVDG